MFGKQFCLKPMLSVNFAVLWNTREAFDDFLLGELGNPIDFYCAILIVKFKLYLNSPRYDR